MKLNNATEGHLNLHSKEFHKLNYTENCDAAHIEDEVILTWQAAKLQDADACGHCFGKASKKNATKNKKPKKVEVTDIRTGFF